MGAGGECKWIFQKLIDGRIRGIECHLENPDTASMERDCLPCMFEHIMEWILLRNVEYRWTMGPNCLPCLYGKIMEMITGGQVQAKSLQCPEGLCPFASVIKDIKAFEWFKRLRKTREVGSESGEG